jgi:hypothetical protein
MTCTNLVEDVLQALLRQRRAFDVLDRAKLPRKALALLKRDGSLLLPLELFHHLRVVAQVYLGADDQTGDARAVVPDLREPLLLYVLERGRGRYAEAHEEDIGLRVGERAQAVVILLTY